MKSERLACRNCQSTDLSITPFARQDFRLKCLRCLDEYFVEQLPNGMEKLYRIECNESGYLRTYCRMCNLPDGFSLVDAKKNDPNQQLEFVDGWVSELQVNL